MEWLCRHPARQCQHFVDALRKCRLENAVADTGNRLDEIQHDVAVGPRRLVVGVVGNERLPAIGASHARPDDLIGRADPAVRPVVEPRNEPALASRDGGVGVASQLVEIGAFLIPDDQIAAPVKRLGVARHDVRHQSETLCSGPTRELHQITHVHVLVAVIEIEFPAWQRIGHHQIDIAVVTLGRLARARLADRPLRRRSGGECHRSRHAHEEKLENRAHVDLLSVGPAEAILCTQVTEGKRQTNIKHWTALSYLR